jgi:hypothetical protein
MNPEWTTPEQVVAVLRKRWDRGAYASAYAGGQPWEPLSVPVRSPAPGELLDRFDEARRWAERFAQDSNVGGSPRWRIEYRTLRSRSVGANRLPGRVWIDSMQQLCDVVGATEARRDLDHVLARTRVALPAAVPWVVAHPLQAAEHRSDWDRLLATVAWIRDHRTTGLYLRQVDVEGVDTKFVEGHRRVLDQLLTMVLDPGRMDEGAPPGDFARRFGFRTKPSYVRLRLLSPQPSLPDGITEVRLRSDELPSANLGASTVVVVENEVTFLALPPLRDAVALFGSGYGLEAANAGEWLAEREVVYWGDIDTHGFAILDGLRARLPHVRSLLMDTETLLSHPGQWGREPVPTARSLPHLDAAEGALYRDLVEDRFGSAVRLEQERIRFSLVQAALVPWAPTGSVAWPGPDQ